MSEYDSPGTQIPHISVLPPQLVSPLSPPVAIAVVRAVTIAAEMPEIMN
jgi:hypothetical protein